MGHLYNVYDSAWEAAQNVALKVIDGGLLHQDAPFSPDVPEDLAADMPDLTGRIPLTLPWDRAKPIDPDKHYVWLFDNIAFQASTADQSALAAVRAKAEHMSEEDVDQTTPAEPNTWQAEFVAAYFCKTGGRDLSDVVAHLAKKLNVEMNSASSKTIEQRVQHFVNTILPRHTVEIMVGQVAAQTLGPSSSSGISSATKTLPATISPSNTIQNSIPGSEKDPRFLTGTTRFVTPKGWGIISDIDDTIKITLTDSPTGLLQTTFVDNPQPAPGMPELYAHLRTALGDPAVLYLSASPYNLYPFLRSFVNQYYPPGPITLRDASWQNLAGLFGSLTQDVQEYKVDRIKKFHAWLPQRTFICFGDSSQKDPESYGEIARTYPGWVKAIFIRKVTGVSEVTDPDQDKKNAPDRFEKAFAGLDRDMWMAFTDPKDVATKIDQLLAKA